MTALRQGVSFLEAFELRSKSTLVHRGLSVEPPSVLPTGIAPLDALLPGGGIPEGRVSELMGKRGQGALSLALAVAARFLARKEPVALLDPSGSVLPDVWTEPLLVRLLVVRGGGTRAALAATDALLRTRAFPLLVLDLPGRTRTSPATLLRLAREARASGTALLLVSEALPWRPDGLASLVSLRLEVRRVPGDPERDPRHLLELVLARSKLGNEGARAVLELCPAAPRLTRQFPRAPMEVSPCASPA